MVFVRLVLLLPLVDGAVLWHLAYNLVMFYVLWQCILRTWDGCNQCTVLVYGARFESCRDLLHESISIALLLLLYGFVQVNSTRHVGVSQLGSLCCSIAGSKHSPHGYRGLVVERPWVVWYKGILGRGRNG